MSKAENMESIRWLDKAVRSIVHDELNKMGIPRLFIPGVVQSVTTTNGKTFANVFLNGAATASTNIPVNPDIATNIVANTPVWVFAINFNNLDLYVALRKLA